MVENYVFHKCYKCDDRGIIYVGHNVTSCSCALGASIHPELLARHQKYYDKGRKIFKSPFDKENKDENKNVFHPLPYDPNERIE